jgi:hypothetical protein
MCVHELDFFGAYDRDVLRNPRKRLLAPRRRLHKQVLFLVIHGEKLHVFVRLGKRDGGKGKQQAGKGEKNGNKCWEETLFHDIFPLTNLVVSPSFDVIPACPESFHPLSPAGGGKRGWKSG